MKTVKTFSLVETKSYGMVVPRKLSKSKLLTAIGFIGFGLLVVSFLKSELVRKSPKASRQPTKYIFKWMRGYNESLHQKIPDLNYLKTLSWPEVASIYHSIGDDFSFDDEMSHRYGCTVHSFDPSTPMGDHRRSANVTFHSTGLSNYDGYWTTWRMRRLDTIMNNLGHHVQRLDIVKLDIEQWEWKTLPDMLASGRLDTVLQLLVEFHISFRPQPRKQPYLDAMAVLKSLYHAGFRIFYTRRNLHCAFRQIFDDRQMAGCHEVHMMRIQ